jgi:hypothetical protein
MKLNRVEICENPSKNNSYIDMHGEKINNTNKMVYFELKIGDELYSDGYEIDWHESLESVISGSIQKLVEVINNAD